MKHQKTKSIIYNLFVCFNMVLFLWFSYEFVKSSIIIPVSDEMWNAGPFYGQWDMKSPLNYWAFDYLFGIVFALFSLLIFLFHKTYPKYVCLGILILYLLISFWALYFVFNPINL